MDNLEFSKKICAYRKDKGLSQKEFGEALGVSNKTVSKWENGESMPKTSTLLKIAQLLEIDGNELIGLGCDNASAASESFELNQLKSENEALKLQLDFRDKQKKRTLTIAGAVLIIGIICSIVFAVFFTVNSESYNKNITDAGEEKTKIVFNNVTFFPASDFTKTVIGTDKYARPYSDKKYAKYYQKNGGEKKAVILCTNFDEYIGLPVGKKTHLYVSERIAKLSVTPENISSLYIESGSMDSGYDYYDSSYITNTYSKSDVNSPFVEDFCKFYKNKGDPVNRKTTELYLGKRSVKLTINWENEEDDISTFNTKIGEFFKDDNGKVYYYDYTDTKAYAVGKELSRYVYYK